MGAIFSDELTFRGGRLAVVEQVDLGEGVTTAQIKEMMTVGKTKEFFLTGVNEFLADPEAPADTAWETIFRTIPSTGPGELFPFRTPTAVGSGSHGIVFKQVGEGGEIEFSKTSATHKYVPNVKYGTAFGFSSEWFEDGSMNLVEMVLTDFRDSMNDKMAAIHYAAIVASVVSGGSVSTALGGTTINHFLNALNADAVVMRRNKRRPDILLIAPEQEQFVRTALATRVANNQPGSAGTGSATEVAAQTEAVRRVGIVVTEHLPDGTTYLIEGKRRLISLNRRALRVDRFTDILHDAETMAATFRRGVLVAEPQVIRARSAVPSTLATS
jgi:hypothetical protein